MRNSGIVSFLIRKLIELVLSLSVLMMLLFLMLKFLPGGPFDSERPLNPAVYERLHSQFQLDTSFWQQGLSYLVGASQGDFGVSMVRTGQSVDEIISQGIRNTLFLNSMALIIVVVGSILTALLMVWRQGSWVESVLEQTMIVFLSLPSLFWGPLLIFLFAFYWNVFPSALLESPSSYVLPLLTLCLRPFASLVRLLKTSLQENLLQDYTRTAVAKGLGRWQVLIHHTLRNSMVAFLSYLGPLSVSLISGSFMVELLFAVPGLGTEFVTALNDRDYTLIAGLTFMYGGLLLLINSLSDVGLKYLDPRLREVS